MVAMLVTAPLQASAAAPPAAAVALRTEHQCCPRYSGSGHRQCPGRPSPPSALPRTTRPPWRASRRRPVASPRWRPTGQPSRRPPSLCRRLEPRYIPGERPRRTILAAAVTSSVLSRHRHLPEWRATDGGHRSDGPVSVRHTGRGRYRRRSIGGVGNGGDGRQTVTDATLRATVRTQPSRTSLPPPASATALQITFRLTGTTAGDEAIDIPLGRLTAGSATCTAPAAPAATGSDPAIGPDRGRQHRHRHRHRIRPRRHHVTIGGTTVPAGYVTVTSPTTLTFAPRPTPPDRRRHLTPPAGTTGPLATPTSRRRRPPRPDPTIRAAAGGNTVTITGTDSSPATPASPSAARCARRPGHRHQPHHADL